MNMNTIDFYSCIMTYCITACVYSSIFNLMNNNYYYSITITASATTTATTTPPTTTTTTTTNVYIIQILYKT